MLIWVDYFLAESHLLHSDTRIKWLCKHFTQSVSSEVLLLFPFVPSKPASWLHLISALCIFVTQINLPFAEGQTAKDRTHIVIRASCIQGGKRNCAAAYHQKIPEVSLVYSCSWNSLSMEQYAHNECGDVLQQPQDIVREREARRKSPQTVICNTSALVRYLRPYPDSSGERPSKIARRKESVQNTSGCKWLLLVTCGSSQCIHYHSIMSTMSTAPLKRLFVYLLAPWVLMHHQLPRWRDHQSWHQPSLFSMATKATNCSTHPERWWKMWISTQAEKHCIASCHLTCRIMSFMHVTNSQCHFLCGKKLILWILYRSYLVRALHHRSKNAEQHLYSDQALSHWWSESHPLAWHSHVDDSRINNVTRLDSNSLAAMHRRRSSYCSYCWVASLDVDIWTLWVADSFQTPTSGLTH